MNFIQELTQINGTRNHFKGWFFLCSEKMLKQFHNRNEQYEKKMSELEE
jgi:hypothetical protein